MLLEQIAIHYESSASMGPRLFSRGNGISEGLILPEGSKNTSPQIDLASIAPETSEEQSWTDSALNMIGFADGGFVQKTGFALVHSGEPIIPAEVANSSKLQNVLESLAYGSEATTSSTINNEPIINIYYNVDPRSGIMMSDTDFERKIRKTVSDALRQKNGY